MGTRIASLWSTALLAAALWLMVSAQAVAQDSEADGNGLRVQIDNDLFAMGGGSDRDYTGGVAVTISGEQARDSALSLDPLLRGINGLASVDDQRTIHYARQVGLMAFTPADIEATEPLHDDRPYASLLFAANGRVSVDADDRGAWTSSLTVGVLGLAVAGDMHSMIHELTGADPVRGYDNQISAGGEPTARYSLARHRLWVANPSSTLDVKTTVQGSVGYLTEASTAISMRIGRFNTPWWSFAPELTDYIGAPLPVVESRGAPEMYFFAGARVKARAYNAFLQGQFRDSVVEYSYSEIEPIVANAWVGFVTHILDNTQVSYTLNYQTAELREGKAAQDQLWGGVQVVHSFQ